MKFLDGTEVPADYLAKISRFFAGTEEITEQDEIDFFDIDETTGRYVPRKAEALMSPNPITVDQCRQELAEAFTLYRYWPLHDPVISKPHGVIRGRATGWAYGPGSHPSIIVREWGWVPEPGYWLMSEHATVIDRDTLNGVIEAFDSWTWEKANKP